MKPSEFVFNDKISNRDKFGAFVRARRLDLGLSVRELAEKMGVSAAYLSDIERGNRMAPVEHLNQMAELLCVDESEIQFFVDLSGCTHSNWPEINEYLAGSKVARQAIRLARDNGMSGEEFLTLVNSIGDKKQVIEIEQER